MQQIVSCRIASFIVLAGALFILLSPQAVSAGGVYQEPDAFIDEVFAGSPPKPRVIWLNKPLKKEMADILAHSYKGMRVRYWVQQDTSPERTVWILEEIGKEKPITVGLIVNSGKIERVKVLVFRESRGWEVRHSFFTDQFVDVGMDKENELTQNIDNISGATLSVRALSKLARIALLLDARVQEKAATGQKTMQAKS